MGGICISLVSCTTRVKDTLGYAPVIEQQGKNRIGLFVNTFNDVRTDKEYIGEGKNLFGIPIIEITTEDNVPNWVCNALKTELTHAGYSILDDMPAEDTYLIEGKIIQAFTSAYFGQSAYMTIEIFLKKGNETIFQKTYETHKNGDHLDLFEYATCTELLKYNLQEVCRNFIADTNEHLLKLSSQASAVQ